MGQGASAPNLPHFSKIDENTASVHGTSVAIAGDGLLIIGPAGAGKSGLAAQLLAFGGRLIADDLTILATTATGPHLTAREGAPPQIEARGLGIAPVETLDHAPLCAIVVLEASPARLPPAEKITVFGHAIPYMRHPYRFDLAAKLWLRPWRGL